MISVIITTYRRESGTVKRAIESVLAQTCKDWELLVVDDNPDGCEVKDAIQGLVLRYAESDPRIQYVSYGNNRGACAARNSGLQLIKGTYVAFLDDDDEWKEDKLEKQLDTIEKSDVNIALVYCGYDVYMDEKGSFGHHKSEYREGRVLDDLIVKNFIGGMSCPLIRTSYLREIGGFDEEMQASQDLDVWLRLCEKYEITYVPENLVIYHIHNGEQITKTPSKRIAGLERKITKHEVYFRTHPAQYSECLMELACTYALGGRRWDAMQTWKKAVSVLPQNIYGNGRGLARVFYWMIRGKYGKIKRNFVQSNGT